MGRADERWSSEGSPVTVRGENPYRTITSREGGRNCHWVWQDGHEGVWGQEQGTDYVHHVGHLHLGVIMSSVVTVYSPQHSAINWWARLRAGWWRRLGPVLWPGGGDQVLSVWYRHNTPITLLTLTSISSQHSIPRESSPLFHLPATTSNHPTRDVKTFQSIGFDFWILNEITEFSGTRGYLPQPEEISYYKATEKVGKPFQV